MSFSDPIGDLLTRIRNGQRAGLATIAAPASKLRENVLSVLQREGFIRSYARDDQQGQPAITIELKYYEGKPVIREIKRVSKPGRRIYTGVDGMRRVYNGMGISILSTPKGVLSDREAQDANVGGEVLCEVF